jgi:hypothetical protein
VRTKRTLVMVLRMEIRNKMVDKGFVLLVVGICAVWRFRFGRVYFLLYFMPVFQGSFSLPYHFP